MVLKGFITVGKPILYISLFHWSIGYCFWSYAIMIMVLVIGCELYKTYGASDNQNLHAHMYDYATNMKYIITGYTNKVFNYANKNFSPNR